jgi:hypothetical protein
MSVWWRVSSRAEDSGGVFTKRVRDAPPHIFSVPLKRLRRYVRGMSREDPIAHA